MSTITALPTLTTSMLAIGTFPALPDGITFPAGFPTGLAPPPAGGVGEPEFPTFTPEELAGLPHDDLGPTVLATVWLLLALAGGFLGLRVYCKISVRRPLWWDDYILILSFIMLFGHCVISTETVRLGYGRHTYDLPFDILLFRLPLLANIGGTFSILAAVWSKTSFAITLLRITQGWLWVTTWCIIVTMNVAMGLSALFIWILCTPIEKSWNPLLEGVCFPVTVIVDFLIFSAAYSAAMDIVLVLMAWRVVFPLNMKRKEKVGVMVAMSMGLFAAATAIIKIVQIPRIKSGDIFDGVVLIIWSTVESAVTIMAASVPILRSLLKGHHKNRQGKVIAPSPAPDPKAPFNPESFTMQSQSTVVIESRRRSVDRSYWKSESRSTRTSLDLQPKEGTILQVHEVAVEYSQKDWRGQDLQLKDDEMGLGWKY